MRIRCALLNGKRGEKGGGRTGLVVSAADDHCKAGVGFDFAARKRVVPRRPCVRAFDGQQHGQKNPCVGAFHRHSQAATL